MSIFFCTTTVKFITVILFVFLLLYTVYYCWDQKLFIFHFIPSYSGRSVGWMVQYLVLYHHRNGASLMAYYYSVCIIVMTLSALKTNHLYVNLKPPTYSATFVDIFTSLFKLKQASSQYLSYEYFIHRTSYREGIDVGFHQYVLLKLFEIMPLDRTH